MKLANFFHNCYNRGGVLFVPFLFYFGFFLSSFLSSFLSVFQDRVSLYSTGCPGTCSVE